MRIGQSSDIHRLVPDRKLILGGVEIESDLGLLGHSDADALTHALAEAILGALALGDLGKWFPDTAPEWEGVNSQIILREVAKMMDERGYRIGNADNSPQGALTPVKGVRTLNTTGETGQDGLDVFNLTRVQTKLRKQIWESTMVLRQTKGCEDLYLVDTPSVVGVRITRVLDSVGNVTVQGALRGRKYSDAVGVAGAFTDIRYKGRNHSLYERKMWQVPYSALTPRKTHNLLVAGRCIGVERGLTYDAREIGTCLLTGQAAGAAAAMAVSSRRSCRDIDVAKLRETLRAQGVYLP